jgi:flavodoxin
MKIGIITYSQTGHTRDVAAQLAEKLQQNHSVDSIHIEGSADDKKDPRKITLQAIPEISDYDCLILGAPVHAFSLAPAMETLLKHWPSLHGKPVGLIMTQHFPYPWMGGNRAMSQFKNLCQGKDGKIFATAIVNWGNKKRPDQISNLITDFSKHLPQ